MMKIRAQKISVYLTEVLKDHQKELRMLLLAYLLLVLLSIFVYQSNVYFWFVVDESVYYHNAIELMQGNFSALNNHYPPLYSVSLIPSLLFPGNLVRNMTIMNSLMMSTLIFSIYGIAQFIVERKVALLCALLSALLSMHLYFPRTIFSENLFLPLLFLTIFIILIPTNHVLKDVFFAVFLAALYLTRYLSLAILPGLLFIWLLLATKNRLPTKLIFLRFTMIIFIASALCAPWIILSIANGEPLENALGFQIADTPKPEQLTVRHLGLAGFLTLILSTLYLGNNLFFVIFGSMIGARNLWRDRNKLMQAKKWRKFLNSGNQFFILVITLTTGFMAAIIRHNWRVRYNFPLVTKFQLRYLAYLAPLALIISFFVLTKIDWKKEKRIALFSATLFGTLLLFSYLILFDANFQTLIGVEVFTKFELRTLTDQGLFLFQRFGLETSALIIASIFVILAIKKKRLLAASVYMATASILTVSLALFSLAELQLGYAVIVKVDEYLDANFDKNNNSLIVLGSETGDWEIKRIARRRHEIWTFLGQEGELTYVRDRFGSDYEVFLKSLNQGENGNVFVLTTSIDELAFCSAYSDIFYFAYLGKDYWIAHCP